MNVRSRGAFRYVAERPPSPSVSHFLITKIRQSRKAQYKSTLYPPILLLFFLVQDHPTMKPVECSNKRIFSARRAPTDQLDLATALLLHYQSSSTPQVAAHSAQTEHGHLAAKIQRNELIEIIDIVLEVTKDGLGTDSK